MLLPYASDRLPTRRPMVTWALLLLTTAITVLVLLSDRGSGGRKAMAILSTFGIVPARFHLYTLLTYTFFHASPGHLLINMFYLWIFGAGVEEAVGRWRFVLLYLASGVVGGLLQLWVTWTLLPQADTAFPIVGASAACAGLVGLYAVRYYRARLSFIGLPFRPHVVAVVALFLAFEIGAGLWDLASSAPADGVANWAHVGGFIFGLVCAQGLHLDEAGRRAYLTADATQAMESSVPGAAIRRWEKVLAAEPNNARAHAEAARAWQLLGDREQAQEHYLQALRLHLAQNRRDEAALLYAQMQGSALSEAGAPPLPSAQLFALGVALEELELHPLAAATLRAVTTRNPEAPEAETALLKVIYLYLHRLQRREEARLLLRLFQDRYPHSQWRARAEELARAAGETPSNG